MPRWNFAVAGLASLLVAGCGVPSLYSPPVPPNGTGQVSETLLAPKVADITDEIACELGRAKQDHGLLTSPYIVTVLLTLQVEDNLDLTPSLGFIHPFKSGAGNVTTTVSGDLGGDRKRTFTSTYYLDSAKLDTAACNPRRDKRRLFTLTGSLGLTDIARDGEGVIARETAVTHTPQNKDDKSIPTFGSTVQFIVTKSITALGPVWAVTHLKGPGGNNGLINGKKVRTDSVTLTFARQYFITTIEQQAARADLADRRKDAENANGLVASARAGKSQADEVAAAQRPRLERELRSRSAPRALAGVRTQLQDLTDRQRRAAADLETALKQQGVAQTQVAESERRASEADARAGADAAAAATTAGQNLLTTMVLQNLNIQPR